MKFTQAELEAAYAQMEHERAEEKRAAEEAATALAHKARLDPLQLQVSRDGNPWRTPTDVGPQPLQYIISKQLTQYDSWNGMLNRFWGAGVEYGPEINYWDGGYPTCPVGVYTYKDIKYKVSIIYYDAHSCGGF